MPDPMQPLEQAKALLGLASLHPRAVVLNPHHVIRPFGLTTHFNPRRSLRATVLEGVGEQAVQDAVQLLASL